MIRQVDALGNRFRVQRQGSGRHGGLHRCPDPRLDDCCGHVFQLFVLLRVLLGPRGLGVHCHPLLQVASPLLLRDGPIQGSTKTKAVHNLLQPGARVCDDGLRVKLALAPVARSTPLGCATRQLVFGRTLVPSGSGGDKSWKQRGQATKQSCEVRGLLHQELADLWEGEGLRGVISPEQRIAAWGWSCVENNGLGTIGDVLAHLHVHDASFAGRLHIALRGLGK
mmetsp:Transcript_87580/g.283552  ORF Transcript_87580/g.283552 Transcript_87580/m.283552 type:complete len:224 (-) Transcript_87580:572-1243(-)